MGVNFSGLYKGTDYDNTVKIDEANKFHKEPEPEINDGWDRVKALFRKDMYGDYSPGMMRVKDTFMMSMVFGALIGGYGRTRVVLERFIRSHQHEKFETPRYAQKALTEQVYVGFFRGAFRFGWRLSLFTSTYVFVSTVISTYRNEFAIRDQIAGGAAAGLIYKLRDGPKASIAGLVVGAGLGTVSGVVLWAGCKVMGTDLNSVVNWHYDHLEQRATNFTLKVRAGIRNNPELGEGQDKDIAFHDHFMSDDDLSLAQSKNSSISRIVEAVRNNDVPASDFAHFPPVAIRKEFEEEQAKLEKPLKNVNPKVETAPAGTEEPIIKHQFKPFIDQRIYEPGKQQRTIH